MTNNLDPDMVYYACIAKETTILAEFNSKDADLGSIALNCLEKAPEFHLDFSHSVHKKTYMFIFEKPYTYFAIFDENLEKPSCISFLESVADSFNLILDQNPLKISTSINSHCFQGDFNPVFHQLLAPHSDLDVVPPDAGKGGDGGSARSSGLSSLLGGSTKKRLFGHVIGGKKNKTAGVPKESRLDMSSEHHDHLAATLSREISVGGSHNKNGLFDVEKAKRVWKKHLWMVLSLDLVVCVILFLIWLWICKGFECLA
ncbi:Phytolongin Phyl2.2 like [Heracleum sosnowskyi]|uniref:Phytolongin Phyl2.2 like n=1 Tax=Heracleum sosnowskyi TaxID=360622 RepID=A0AAD8JBP7_9APIA|nr:Phytolongin Phyl2.2 like [Heracleum sosnowskyi]